MKTWDVIVVGGGIIGLSLSLELRKQGARVLVIDKGEPGKEASSAAGGMLVDHSAETSPALQPLAAASARMYPEFADELQLVSGISVDLRDQGTVVFPSSEPSTEHSELALSNPLPAPLAEVEPEIADDRPAFYLKERSVDPCALVAAVLSAAKKRGVDISSADPVTDVNIADGRTCGVSTTKTQFLGGKVVNCAGAWSGQIGPYAFPTRPVKGQMLCFVSSTRALLKHVIRSPEIYLIPRSDGRILAGSTVEEAGFDKRTDTATIQRMYRAAVAMVPALKDARILEDWAGLRPGTPDALPILGATATSGYYIATGHFRDGILLAPITARLMAQVITGKDPEQSLDAFSPNRFLA